MKVTTSLLVLLLGAPCLAVPVSVSVVDAKGAPVAGADVQLQSFAKSPEGTVATSTDAQGVASFEVEPSKAEPDLLGRVTVWNRNFALGGGNLMLKKPLRIVLQASNSVSGTITDEAHHPIAGATVTFSFYRPNGQNGYVSGVYLSEGPLKDKMQTVSGTDGNWKLDHLPSDVLVGVAIRAPGRANAEGQIPSGGSIQTALHPGAQINGRLLDLDGKPLAGVPVYARQQSKNSNSRSYTEDKTAADGTFHLSGLERGVYTVGITPGYHEPFVVAVTQNVAATPEKVVQLPDARAVAGTVIGGQVMEIGTKTPVAGVYITLQGDENPDDTDTAVTDEGGHWKMRTLEKSGKLLLQGPSAEFIPNATPRTVAIAGDNLKLNFELARAPKITGRLVDENGKGIQTSSLAFLQNYNAYPFQSDENGNFSAVGPKGEMEITTISDGDQENAPKWDVVGTNKFSIPSNKPLEIHLKPAQISSMELGVFDQNDAAVEGAKIVVNLKTKRGQDESWQPRELVSDKTGHIHLGDIRSDQSVAIQSATKDGFDALPLPPVEKLNGVYRADIKLTRRDGKAGGELFDATGAPVAGASVFGNGIETVSDAKGHFLLAPLPSGKTEIMAWKDDGFVLGSSDQTRLELRPQTLELTDRDRAKAVLDALREESKNTGYWNRDSLNMEANEGDFDTLAASVQASGDIGTCYRLIELFGSDASIAPEKWVAVFGSIKKPSARLYALALWNAKAPSVGSLEAWRALLGSLESDVAGIETEGDASQKGESAIGILGAAAFCERLGQSARSDALFERGQVFVIKNFPEKGGTNGQNPSQDDMFGAMGEICAVSPRFLSKTLALVDADSPAFLRLLQDGAPVVARLSGLDAARPFLDQLKNAPAPKPDANGSSQSVQWLLLQSVTNSILAGGKSDPKLALELAQSLPKNSQMEGDYGRDRAICEAAFFQSPEAARSLWRESLPRLDASQAMRFITRIAGTDEPLARGFYETIRDNLDARPDDPNAMRYGHTPRTAAFAFYEARFAPARARYRLERGFQKARKSPDSRYDLEPYARAMAIFNANRATQWAGQIGNTDNNFGGFEAKRRIARWLALDPAARQKLNFGSQYGSSSSDF